MTPNQRKFGAIMRQASRGVWPEFLAKFRELRPWAILSIVAAVIGFLVLTGLGDNRESLVFVFAVFACVGGVLLASILVIILVLGLILTWLRDVAELRRQNNASE